MALHDPYPSRRSPKPAIMARRDPVSYGTRPEKGPLSAETVARYSRDGFLLLEDFLDGRALSEILAELERLWRSAEAGDETVVREPESNVVRSIFDVHRRSPVCTRVARDPGILAIVEQLLGGPVYVHQSRINYKRGFDGKEFYWHSDFETWHVEDGMPRMRAISVSIALADNLPVNGPLMLIPGSHKHYVSCVGETPDEHYKSSLRRQEFGVPDPESLEWLAQKGGGITATTGRAGSLILFDCNTMHGSGGNMSPYPRSNLFMVYNSVENRLDAPFGGKRPRPGFVTSRDFRPLKPE